MNPSPELLRCDHISVRYPGATGNVLEECSLLLAHGEHVALVGLNGSGKTSLLYAVAGLLPHEGAITIDGIRLTSSTVGEIRRRIGFLFTNPEDQLLFPVVREDVAFSLTRLGYGQREAGERADDMLELLGVRGLGDSTPYAMSHGQKLRVALAGALVHRPPLLLLDEPSSVLDPPGKRALGALLRALPGGMLIATHDLDLADLCCDRFLLMQSGRIARDTSRLRDLAL
jgi:energy-coupling factor transporter ATP-binding protein EcfA2